MKKAFTLIELMVVIVIIGILVAIAVPKLFGMSSKSKAAEIGPAVGTWSKVQGTYFAETGSTGSFNSIGYRQPSSNTFVYSDLGTTTNEGKWIATMLNNLGECLAVGNQWTAVFSILNKSVVATLPAQAECLVLTPNFTEVK